MEDILKLAEEEGRMSKGESAACKWRVVIRDIWVECCGHLSAFDIILKLTNSSKLMDFNAII